MQIKTTVRHHCIPIITAKIQSTNHTKCSWGFEATGTLINCWWEFKMVWPLWKTVWFLTKFSSKLMLWTVVLEKTLVSPLDCKEIKPVNPKGNQSWKFIGRTDAEAPILWSPVAKNRLTGKDPDAGQDWMQEEKGMTTEDEMVGWHHQLSGHEFEQALGVGDGQGGLARCSPWGHKESDTTEWLNWTGTHVMSPVMALQDVHVLLPGTFTCGTLHGQRDFAGVIPLRGLRRRDCPGLSGWAQCNPKGPYT